ncbi:hypothetical protein QAD02_015870 [Eretmocerus hayati]|uniref:Uncharacterized protein n=1 Tax=Eretmocerus hayati TaxID=131215 RepID=A0ACC2PAG8_9HYME|nr:hypothetical protein QAD02_015870 [Eretmocerus hayati]
MLKYAAVSGFMCGLPDKIKSAILTKERFVNLGDAINLATRLKHVTESSMKKNLIVAEPGIQTIFTNKVHTITETRRCHTCQEPDHLMRNCPNKKLIKPSKVKKEAYPKDACTFRKFRGHTGENCRFNEKSKNFLKCNSCTKAGHLEEDCRLKEKLKREVENNDTKNLKNAQQQGQELSNVLTSVQTKSL